MLRQRAFKIVLGIVGLFFIALLYPLTTNLWHASRAEVEPMFFSIYVTLGVFLLLAVRNPAAHRSLIAFTAWSSLAHAAVMAVQAVQHPADRGDLIGGTAIFLIIAAALIALAPARRGEERSLAAKAS